MDQFFYDTHVHTSESSGCGKAGAEETAQFYKEKGFSGIFITDHLHGLESAVFSEEKWNEKIDVLISGYKKARETGKKIGLTVYFAWEFTSALHGGTDFLTYGLNEKWLRKTPEVSGMGPSEYCDCVHAEGGFISHAHPFREAKYIKMIRLLPRNVDAVEVFNANRTEFENERALDYSAAYNLLKTGGSDNHLGYKQENIAAMAFNSPLKGISDFISRVKSGGADIVAL